MLMCFYLGISNIFSLFAYQSSSSSSNNNNNNNNNDNNNNTILFAEVLTFWWRWCNDNFCVCVCSFLLPNFRILQAACNEEAEKYERAFILQLLASANSSNSKEVLRSFFSTLCESYVEYLSKRNKKGILMLNDLVDLDTLCKSSS